VLVRRAEEADLKEIETWFKARGSALPRRDILPLETSLVVTSDEQLVAFGSLFVTNSKLCLLEYFQTNHKQPRLKQSRGLHQLIMSMQALATSSGASVIMGFVPEDNLALPRLYQRLGAVSNTKKMTLHWKVLREQHGY
jgi:hypothetical protein